MFSPHRIYECSGDKAKKKARETSLHIEANLKGVTNRGEYEGADWEHNFPVISL